MFLNCFEINYHHDIHLSINNLTDQRNCELKYSLKNENEMSMDRIAILMSTNGGKTI